MPAKSIGIEDVVRAIEVLRSKNQQVTAEGVKGIVGGRIDTIRKSMAIWDGMATEDKEAIVAYISANEGADVKAEPKMEVKDTPQGDVDKADKTGRKTTTGANVAQTPKANPSKDTGNEKPKAEAKTVSKNPQGQSNVQDERPQPKTKPVTPKFMDEQAAYAFSDKDSLAQCSPAELQLKVQRLESILYKEQFRRDAAEQMAQEVKNYAGIIKEQVAGRIKDQQALFDEQKAFLEGELRRIKDEYAQDLKFYREQLERANIQLAEFKTDEKA